MTSSNGGDNIKLSVIVSLFTWIQKTKTTPKKRLKFRKFLDAYVTTPSDAFATIRLLLPGLDRDRGSYGLKEHVLATCVIDGLGMARDSRDAVKLVNWRKGGGGGGMGGGGVGNFGAVAEEVLKTRLGSVSGGVTVRELNELLDRLASAENRGEKTSVLSELMRKTNAQEMKWIIMIILKDLKLGISEKSIFHEFHPDAEDLFNVTCDLKLVCEKLRDRSQRHKRQDIEVGKAVRPQLALRVNNATAAWKKFHGKEVVLECKFDGDRIQIHKNHSEANFFSRNFLDHQEYSHGMSDIIAQNILVERCILDGEMLVWDTSADRFADFGSNQEIAKAAKEGLDSDRQLCYVAFDILYVGDTSVIHQSLTERHELLRKVVKPIKGRLEILVPHGGLNTRRPSGEPCWSLVAHDVDEVEKFFKETVENRDEGIVLKDLGSKWEPSDRSGKWLKLKPDYVRAGSDLDVLIIGGYYGSGRHGGEVAQFLVGIADRPTANTHPRRFLSFCRVGTGLSDEELQTVVTKLKPYFRKNDYPKKAPPSFYQVTNNSKERPDVWIESPEKSIILSITSDIRTISSEVFAAPYSLRFPRIDRVRYDKPWYECLDLESFVELVHSNNGNTQKQALYEAMQSKAPKRATSSRKGEKNITAVPSHFIQTDVSHIKSETSIFSNMVLYFVNVPSSHSLDSLHKMVAEHGGTFSMNLNNSVTHCIAAESKGIKFQAAKLHGDIIHCSWLFDCYSQKKLLPLQPKYFLFLSDSTKMKLQEEIDEFGDSYYLDIDLTDINQILGNVDHLVDPKTVSYYKKKYCPKEKWIMFHDCCIYFYLPTQYMNSSDWKILFGIASTRLRIEVSFGGGRVVDNLFHASHFVVMSVPEHNVDFKELLSSFSAGEQRLLRNKRLHVVSSQWLEESLNNEQKLPEDSYTLRPNGEEDSIDWESSEHDVSLGDSSSSALQKEKSVTDNVTHSGKTKVNLDMPSVVTLSPKSGQRKRGRPVGQTTNKGKSIVKQPRRTRARGGSKPVKICEDEPVESVSEEDQTVKELSGSDAENYDSHKILNDHISKNTVNEHAENSGILGDRELGGDAGCNMETDGLLEGHERSYGDERTRKKLFTSEHIDDPVQAMLFGLIPSLGTQKEKAESSQPDPVDENLTDELKPVKKKKVSYKEMADELLKDW